MIELILFAVVAGLFGGVMVVGFSAILALVSVAVFRSLGARALALTTSGMIPVGFSVLAMWPFADPACCDSGPAVQGLLILVVLALVLLVLIWPISFRINKAIIEERRI